MFSRRVVIAAVSALAVLTACGDSAPTPEQRLQSNGIKYANGSTDQFGKFSFDIPGSTCTGKMEHYGRLYVYDGTPRTVIATFEPVGLSGVVNDAATRHCFKEK